jgi:hypothetical protein
MSCGKLRQLRKQRFQHLLRSLLTVEPDDLIANAAGVEDRYTTGDLTDLPPSSSLLEAAPDAVERAVAGESFATASSSASSWAALRRKSSACSRRFIEDLPLVGGFVINVTWGVPPILKLFVANHKEVNGNIEGAKESIETDDLPKTIRGFLFHDHDVEVAMISSFAPPL